MLKLQKFLKNLIVKPRFLPFSLHKQTRFNSVLKAGNWDPITENQLIDLMESGATNKEICSAFSPEFSQSSVYNKMNKLRNKFPSLKRTNVIRKKWDPILEKRLMDLMGAGVSNDDIYSAFSPEFSQSAVHNKMNKLRKKFSSLKRNAPTSLTLETFIDNKWDLEEIKTLVSLINNRLRLEEIAQRWSSRSVSEVKEKVIQLLENRVEEVNLREAKSLWTHEEETLLMDLKKQNLTWLNLSLTMGRTRDSIHNKIVALNIGRKSTSEGHDWLLFEKQGYLQVPVSQWPARNINNDSQSLCYFISPLFLTNKNVALVTSQIRSIIQQAEFLNAENINIWVLKDETYLNEYLLTANRQKEPSILPNFTPFFRDLIRATLLTDGTITKLTQYNKSNYRFEFVQAASLLINTSKPQSHLEYVLWFFSQVNPCYYQPNIFRLSRGIPLQKINLNRSTFKYTWKARVILHNFPGIEVYYDHFYGHYSPEMIQELKKANKRVYKQLPTPQILNAYFQEGNINFMLAHMFMQDGSASTEQFPRTGKLYRTVALYLFSKSFEQNECLAYLIWEKTGLKFRPLTALKDGELKTTLYLCLTSVSDFFTRVQPYMLHCMEYKIFSTVDLNLIPEVVQFQETQFQNGLNSWKKRF